MGSVASSFSAALESVSVEAYSGRTTQGKPSYGNGGLISAIVLREDKVVRTGAGEEVRTTLSLVVDAGETYLPVRSDRVTTSDGTFIVVKRELVKTLDGVADHVECDCREESNA